MQSRHNIWTYQSVIVNLSDCKLRYMLIKGDKKGKKKLCLDSYSKPFYQSIIVNLSECKIKIYAN